MASSLTHPINLAILDDYHNLAAAHFSHIPSNKLSTTVFPDTLPSYSHPNTTDSERKVLVTRLQPFSVLSTMRERTAFPADLIVQLPNLKVIFATGTQFESWDLNAMRERGIKVYAAPGKGRIDGKGRFSSELARKKPSSAHPTTQHVWALILALARNVAADDAVVKGKNGPSGWQTNLAIGLQGKTLGLIGLGRIGAQVARVGALAFGMKVICWSANLTQEKADQLAQEIGLGAEGGGGEKTFKVVSKEELLRTADVITIHYVLSPRSRDIVSTPDLALMKSSALLVNTSRGPLINEAALLDTLRHGRIGGAAIDVFDLEPLPSDSPWRTEDWDAPGKSRVLLTPHMGYVEEERMNVWYEETAENVERLVEGKELLHSIV